MRLLSRLARPLLGRAWPQTRGRVTGLELRGSVELLRDRWGIPHIFAGNEHDLFAAQGFVHAQDRLWQMESQRRLVSGRLSEAAGEAAIAADVFVRLLGLPDMRRRAAEALSADERSMIEAYAEGVNAYIGGRGRDLPLEFRSTGITPEPWSVQDALSFLVHLAWSMPFPSLAAKLFALVKGRDLTLRQWDDLFPSSPGERLPPDPYFDTLARLRMGPLHPAMLAMHGPMPAPYDAATLRSRLSAAGAAAGAEPAQPGAGSNAWVVSRSADGKPLLANDTHLGLRVPAVWYHCHLSAPGIDAAGASIAGTPGIVIGRNRRVAWGFTNVVLDAFDVLILRVDPREPEIYRIGERRLAMERKQIRIGLKGGREVVMPLLLTEHGPAITAVELGVEAVAVLKWHGTLPEGMQRDRSFSVIPAFLRSQRAADIIEAGRACSWISQNFLAADVDGDIAWHATGAVPVRQGYGGRLPADATSGADWKGFVPYDDLPHVADPPQGFIVTANQKTTDELSKHPVSFYWTGPYRYERITAVLRGARAPALEDFRLLQMDTHSVAADAMLPRVLAWEYADAGAREAAEMLRAWDRRVEAGSPGAALFEAFLVCLERRLTEPVLGPDAVLYLKARVFGVVDVALERPQSPWWSGEEPRAVVEQALAAAVELLHKSLGPRRARWRWSRLHRYVFRHPGATGAIAQALLNPRSRPAGGDCNTVNVSWYSPGRGSFDVTTVPSQRMIAPLGDIDGMRVIMPLGQSGQPGHRHYEDMIEPWVRGDLVPLPLTRGAVERIARERLVLEPPPPKA